MSGLRLPTSAVSPLARCLVIGEAVGRITLQVNGVQVFDTPQFRRIRVNGRGAPIWSVSVNLPHRNASLLIHSTLPPPTLAHLIAALM